LFPFAKPLAGNSLEAARTQGRFSFFLGFIHLLASPRRVSDA
jgi:hypothetical protein